MNHIDPTIEMPADVIAFLAELRRFGDAPPPPPSPELAAILAGATPMPTTGFRHARGGRAALVAAAITAGTVGATGVAAAHETLPRPAQRVVSNVVNGLTPFHLDPSPAVAAVPPVGPVPVVPQPVVPQPVGSMPSGPTPALPIPAVPAPRVGDRSADASTQDARRPHRGHHDRPAAADHSRGDERQRAKSRPSPPPRGEHGERGREDEPKHEGNNDDERPRKPRSSRRQGISLEVKRYGRMTL